MSRIAISRLRTARTVSKSGAQCRACSAAPVSNRVTVYLTTYETQALKQARGPIGPRLGATAATRLLHGVPQVAEPLGALDEPSHQCRHVLHAPYYTPSAFECDQETEDQKQKTARDVSICIFVLVKKVA